MPIFTFPRKLIFQRDITEDLSDLFLRENVKKVVLFTDQTLRQLYKNRIDQILQHTEHKIYSDIMPEPKIESIDSIVRAISQFNPDTIIAMGGGSVIDTAKSVAIKLTYPDLDLHEVNPFEPLKLKVLLIAIPTTSGTGSDVSFGIVLSDHNTKLALGNYELVPIIDILDSALTPNIPEIIRATGIDALVHAFEAISATTATIFTDALAEKAIYTIFKNLPHAMNNEETAKDQMHLAATMAGMAFSNSGTALAHAMGHSLGATFHIVHGTAVGLLLPYVIKFNAVDIPTAKKYMKIAHDLNLSNIDALLNYLLKFYELCGQPSTVKQLHIEKSVYLSKFNELITKTLQDSELVFNPVFVSDEEIKTLFLKAFEGVL